MQDTDRFTDTTVNPMVCLGTLQKSDIHVPNLIQRSDRIISMKGI